MCACPIYGRCQRKHAYHFVTNMKIMISLCRIDRQIQIRHSISNKVQEHTLNENFSQREIHQIQIKKPPLNVLVIVITII